MRSRVEKVKQTLERNPEYVILVFFAVLMAIVILLLVIGHGWSEERWWYSLLIPLAAWSILYLAWLKKQN